MVAVAVSCSLAIITTMVLKPLLTTFSKVAMKLAQKCLWRAALAQLVFYISPFLIIISPCRTVFYYRTVQKLKYIVKKLNKIKKTLLFTTLAGPVTASVGVRVAVKLLKHCI